MNEATARKIAKGGEEKGLDACALTLDVHEHLNEAKAADAMADVFILRAIQFQNRALLALHRGDIETAKARLADSTQSLSDFLPQDEKEDEAYTAAQLKNKRVNSYVRQMTNWFVNIWQELKSRRAVA